MERNSGLCPNVDSSLSCESAIVRYIGWGMQNRRHSRGIRTSLLLLAAWVASGALAQTPPEAAAIPSADAPVDPPQETAPPDTDVPQPEETERPKGREICVDENYSRAVIDRLHSSLYKLTCSTASWFDGLFGDARYDEEYRSTYGSATVGALWSQRKSWEEVLRFRAKLELPQMNKRLHAFVGRVDRDDYVSESESDVYGLPEEFNRDRSEQTVVGVGYNEPLKKRGSFDLGSGVRIRFPLDPYVKGSYRFARPIGEKTLFRLRETVFWQNSEEFGVTSRIDWDRILGQKNLLRYTGSATYSQRSEGVRWFTHITLFSFLSTKRALAYELAANGSTDHEVPLTDYGASIIYRQRVWREWLLLEFRAGVDWPRDWLYEERRSNLNAGLAFELRFGRDPAQRDVDAIRNPADEAQPLREPQPPR
jgi:hypothetical protein